MFVREFSQHYYRHMRVVVFAGQGNNGADALAISRLLAEDGYRVETYLFNPTNHLSSECEENRLRLREIGNVKFTEVVHEFDTPKLSDRDVVVDGLFGSGLTRPLTGGFAAVVKHINESITNVVAIDIPSGLFGEDNSNNNKNTIIKADLTLTFGFPKLAFLFHENAQYVGEWKVLDIGLHPDAIYNTTTSYSMITEEDISESLKKRERFSHKGTFGHALLVAGSKGKMGAAILAAKACLRSGAGLLTAHIPNRGECMMQTALPEAMVSLDTNPDHFSMIPEVSSFDAIGIGPGLGQHMESSTAFDRILQSFDKPMVIDADAINMLASNQDMLAKIPVGSIITPHPKEFDRIAGESKNSMDRLKKAHSFAKEHKITVVLKGAYTATCTPAGNIYFNSSGNPGMATAGSGDVLTGIILALLAQGYSPESAAGIAVYLHGIAGDRAAATLSEESMIASDITDLLGIAFKQIK